MRRERAEERTYLNNLVPSGGDNDGVGGVGGESNARNPLGVALVLDVKLALSKGVPELDGSVSGSGDNLSVVGRERDGENVGGVANESLGGETGVQVPESEGVVPRRGESELSVGGDDNVGDEVVVSLEDLLGVTVRSVVSGELPRNDGLVYGTGRGVGSSVGWYKAAGGEERWKRRAG